MYLADSSGAHGVQRGAMQIIGQGRVADDDYCPGSTADHYRQRPAPVARTDAESVGTARTDVEVRVVDEGRNPLPANESGEIHVRATSSWLDIGTNRATARDACAATGCTPEHQAFDESAITSSTASKDLIVTAAA